jgi:hypothetical protein
MNPKRSSHERGAETPRRGGVSRPTGSILGGPEPLSREQVRVMSNRVARRWPSVGDVVHTFGPKWPPKALALTLAIQSAQKCGTWDGIPKIPAPYWRLTHSMAYVGALPEAYISEAARVGLVDPAQVFDLRKQNDWMFSMTHPVGMWVRYSTVKSKHHVISRPRFCDFREDWQVRAWQHALWWWCGRRYDVGQLAGILSDLSGEHEPQEYSGAFDAAPWRTVCSGAVASAYEAVRRQAILRAHAPADAPEWITCDLAEWPNGAGDGWWPRILNGLHLERIAPGHLCLEAWFAAREIG